jgi:hypothetical protein
VSSGIEVVARLDARSGRSHGNPRHTSLWATCVGPSPAHQLVISR